MSRHTDWSRSPSNSAMPATAATRPASVAPTALGHTPLAARTRLPGPRPRPRPGPARSASPTPSCCAATTPTPPETKRPAPSAASVPHPRRIRPQGAKDWTALLRLPALLQHYAGQPSSGQPYPYYKSSLRGPPRTRGRRWSAPTADLQLAGVGRSSRNWPVTAQGRGGESPCSLPRPAKGGRDAGTHAGHGYGRDRARCDCRTGGRHTGTPAHGAQAQRRSPLGTQHSEGHQAAIKSLRAASD